MTREQLTTQIADRQESLLFALKDMKSRITAMRDDAMSNVLPRYALGTFAARIDELANEIKVLNQVLLATPE